MIDKDIVEKIEAIAKERKTPMGEIERLELGAKLQKEKLSEDLCSSVREDLKTITNKVKDLAKNDVGISSLIPELNKLATAMNRKVGTADARKPVRVRPSAAVKKAAILFAFHDKKIQPKLSQDMFSITSISKAADDILKMHNPKFDGLKIGELNAAINDLCVASVACTDKDKDAFDKRPRGKTPKKTKLKSANAKPALKSSAITTLRDYAKASNSN